MNSGPLVFLGAFFALATSWLGFILAPQLQLGNQPQVEAKSGETYPAMRSGLARQGEQVYRANGCFYCHSQQVRPATFGGDYARNWGGRSGMVQSVNQDYLYDRPAMLGTQRIGPDLSNLGLRQTNTTLLMLHLYDARITMPKSVMPPYRFLFEKRKLKFGGKPSDEALPLGKYAPAGYEIIPTDSAKAVVAYLLSLHSDAVLFEAPPMAKPATTNAVSTNVVATNTVAAGTNAPAATNSSTNAPVK